MNDLSVLIPARSEMFLRETIEDIVKNREADTDVIALLDGAWADPPIPQLPNVNLIYVKEPLGQRAAANMACRLSNAKYVMKVDAHCSFDKGFDKKMLEGFEKTGDNVVMVPIMRNLWAFDWKCMRCGWSKYQGPTPEKCDQCGFSNSVRRDMKWIGKKRPQSVSYCFDAEPHFQYFNEYKKRDEYKEDLKTGFTKTMSLQGSAFMLTRENWWKLKISEEELGNWGNQGIEVACKMWLSGGNVLVNHNTWYAHMFRTQGGDFGFPWKTSQKIKGKGVQATKKNVWDQILEGRCPQQIRPVRWLVERFWPVKGWEQADLDKLPKTI